MTSHRVTKGVMTVTEWSCHRSRSQHVMKKSADGHENYGRQDA